MKRYISLLSLFLGLLVGNANTGPVHAATTSMPARPVRVLCAAISTSNITRSGPQTVDTVSAGVGNVACLVGESDSKNGAYLVQAGAWKAIDPGLGTGLELYAAGGSANINTVYGCDTAGAIVWGTTSTSFTKKSTSGAAFNPAAPGPIGGTTPSTGSFSGLTSPSLAASAGNPLALSSGIIASSGAAAVTITSSTTQDVVGGGLIELSNNNGLGNVGNLFIGYPSGGQSDALCDGVILSASGAISDGDVVIWVSKNTVSKSTASASLTTIAGIAVGAASSGKVRVAQRGLVYVNAVVGVSGAGTMLGTSGVTAGAVVGLLSTDVGTLIGRSLEATGATISGKLLCHLTLG